MTRYLIDTNVVSELAKRAPHPAVVAWLSAAPDCLLSVLTLGELRRGARMLERRDAPRAARLDAWIDGLIIEYGSRIIPVDAAVMEHWARLPTVRTVPVIDGLIAATAREHRLTVATRNVSDFAELGVPVHDPFA